MTSSKNYKNYSLVHLKMMLNLAGIPFGVTSKPRQFFIKTLGYLWYIFFSLIFNAMIYLKHSQGYRDTEPVLVMWTLMFGSYICHRMMASKLDKVEYMLELLDYLLDENGLNMVRFKDRRGMKLHLFLLAANALCLTIFTGYHWNTLIERTPNLVVHFGIYTWPLAVAAFSICSTGVIYGTIGASTRLYLMVMYYFGVFASFLNQQFLMISLKKDLSHHDIIRIRKKLRMFWDMKADADTTLGSLPFIWLIFEFFSVTTIFTRAVADWDEENRIFLTLNLYCITINLLLMILTIVRTDQADMEFQKCLKTVFSMNDPRLIEYPIPDQELSNQLTLLQSDLKNGPDVTATVLGMVHFDRRLMLSYSGALVNFSIMIINIRMAQKTL